MPSHALHCYRAYGLVWESSIALPALDEAKYTQADIRIELADDAAIFEGLDLPNSYANWRAGPNRLLLDVEGVARFLIENGERIRVLPAEVACEDTIRAFLIGSAFAVILQQRGFLTIHASAVKGPGGAILFVGRSGVGKSTTLAALHQRGLEMVTDDVAAIQIAEDGTAVITPSFSGGRITADALNRMGQSTAQYRKLDAEIEKYAMPIALAEDSRVSIERIFILESSLGPGIELLPVESSEAFMLLSRYTFRKRLGDGMGLQRSHFRAVTAVVNSTKVLKVRRPDVPFMLDELAEAILHHLAASEI